MQRKVCAARAQGQRQPRPMLSPPALSTSWTSERLVLRCSHARGAVVALMAVVMGRRREQARAGLAQWRATVAGPPRAQGLARAWESMVEKRGKEVAGFALTDAHARARTQPLAGTNAAQWPRLTCSCGLAGSGCLAAAASGWRWWTPQAIPTLPPSPWPARRTWRLQCRVHSRLSRHARGGAVQGRLCKALSSERGLGARAGRPVEQAQRRPPRGRAAGPWCKGAGRAWGPATRPVSAAICPPYHAQIRSRSAELARLEARDSGKVLAETTQDMVRVQATSATRTLAHVHTRPHTRAAGRRRCLLRPVRGLG